MTTSTSTKKIAPKLIETAVVTRLKKIVTLHFYDDDSIRFTVDPSPFVIAEAWLPGKGSAKTIIKIARP